MIIENKNIYEFPLEEFKHYWPFDPDMASELFLTNCFGKYYSFKGFLEENMLEGSSDGRTIFYGFFIENNQIYYEKGDNELYTFQNVPYALILSSAIKFEITHYSFSDSKGVDPYLDVIWSNVLKYLLFTTYPVREIIEECEFMQKEKKLYLPYFYTNFIRLEETYKYELNRFFSKKDCKERLLYVFLFCEIPKNKAEALTEKCCVKKEFSAISTYYKEIL